MLSLFPLHHQKGPLYNSILSTTSGKKKRKGKERTTFNCVYTFNNHSLCQPFQASKPHTKKKINARGSALRTLRERSNTKKKRHHIPPNIFWRFNTFSFVSLCKSMPFTADFFFFFLMLILGFPCRIFFHFFSFWISDSYPTSCFSFFFFSFFSFSTLFLFLSLLFSFLLPRCRGRDVEGNKVRYRWVEIVSRSGCGREKGNTREEICVNIYINFRLIGKCDICAQIQFKSLVGEKNKRVYICIILSPTRSFHPHKLFSVLLRYHLFTLVGPFISIPYIGSLNVKQM